MARSERASPYRFVIGGLIMLLAISGTASFVAVPPVLPLITEEYEISYGDAGLLVGVVSILAILTLPGGILVSRLGLKRTYTVSALMMGVPVFTVFSPSFEGLLALRIIYGLGLALWFPATGPLVMQWFPSRERPIMIGLNVACNTIGMVVALSTAAPMADLVGWQMVVGAFGGVVTAGAVAWHIFGRVQQEPGAITRPLELREVWSVLRERTVIIVGLANAVIFGLYFALTAWLPTFYNEQRGMSPTQAGFITSMLPFMGLVGVLLGAFLPFGKMSRRMLFIVPGVMIGLGSLGSFLIGEVALIYVAVTLMGLGTWMCLARMLAISMELPTMTPQRIVVAWGWQNSIVGIANFTSPFGVGAMRDSLGSFIPGFLVFTGLSAFLFVAAYLLPKAETPGGQVEVPPSSTAPAQE